MLRRLRERAGLTQEQLAERAGLSARAIRALECGERTHPYPHTVRSVARALDLDDEDRSALEVAVARRRQASDPQALLDGLPVDAVPSTASLPPGSRVAFAPNPLFVGRAAELRQIAATFRGGRTVAIGHVLVITGLGGLGKSQLAVEFVHRYGRFFAGGVFWISFASAPTIPLEVAACAGPGAMRLAESVEGLSLEDRLELVKAAWQSAVPRLLVFDNCEEEGLLESWRPPSGGCRVLVTSRRSEWSPTLGVATLPLDLLPRPNSIELLRRHRPDVAADDPGFNAIAHELADLPLALHLAGSYLRMYRVEMSLKDYLGQIRRPEVLEHASLLGRGLEGTPSPTHHIHSLAQTFAVSLGCLDRTYEVDRVAIALLARMACLPPGEAVPRDLLGKTLEEVDPLRRADGLRRLEALALVDVGEGWLRLHRLLAYFVRQNSLDPNAESAVDRALIKYGIVLGVKDRHDPAMIQYSLETILDFTERLLAKVVRSNPPRTAPWLHGLAARLHDQGELSSARMLFERSLAIEERVFGPYHPATARGLNDLALLLHDQGDLVTARRLFERAVSIYERVLGFDHLFTAIGLYNLALLLQDQGQQIVAMPLIERAVSIYEAVLGRDHEATIEGLDNIAQMLQNQTNPAAEPRFERAYGAAETPPRPRPPYTDEELTRLFGFDKDGGSSREYPPRRRTLSNPDDRYRPQ